MVTEPLVFEIDETEFLPAFRPYVNAMEAVQIFIGSAGSGKSVFLYKRAVAFALGLPYFRMLFARKVKDTIRDSVFLGFKDVITEWGLTDYFQIKDGSMDIICKLNGNMLLSFGMDDPEKLKSVKDITHVLYEEFSDSEQGDFAELQRRLRTDKIEKTQFWGALNPVAGWWGREYFFQDSEADEIPNGRVAAKTEDTLILKTTYHTNPHIDQESYRKKNQELAALDENNWTVYELGNWGKLTTGGEFMHQFKKRLHTADVAFTFGIPVHLTFDFNILPYMTMLAAQAVAERTQEADGTTVTTYHVRFFREYCLEQPFNTTEACVQAFLHDFGSSNSDIFLYGDAMGNKRHEGTGHKTEFKKVREMLARWTDDSTDRTNRSNPSVMQSRAFCNKIFSGQEVAPGVKVSVTFDRSMRKTIADLENTKVGIDGVLKERHTDKKTGQSWEKWGHCTDAVRYLLVKMFNDYFRSFTV